MPKEILIKCRDIEFHCRMCDRLLPFGYKAVRTSTRTKTKSQKNHKYFCRECAEKFNLI